MENPIVVEVTRGGRVESRHRGAFAVVDAKGRAVHAAGDIEAPVFPRSAVKVLQALPLIESGAADRFGLGARELSLICASHSGEEGHVALASDILAKAGLGEGDLECGCHWPFAGAVARRIAGEGREPNQLHNNCSGKHSGFLCTAVHLGEATRGYVGARHPVQERVRAALADLTGTALDPEEAGIDGCSIPTYAAPLRGFAQAFARIVADEGAAPERLAAGRRLIEACMAEPWYMAGTRRACTLLMEAAPGRVFAKTGAEGVFCGAVPELGLGFALKIEDGATRAAEALTASLLARLFEPHDPALAAIYAEQSRAGLRNWKKTETGEVRAMAL
ncbi:asparaginase [Aureimonas endophytica]|uniref:Asparaginase n=1 Tax=Aureimonas endophytica TaxID=2027858 RepID=A0A917ECK3_9HYPH|nr:asparaginase [Aureimonas endophytica]GGE24141.1 asparaginase [Aureimonas endophytica]